MENTSYWEIDLRKGKSKGHFSLSFCPKLFQVVAEVFECIYLTNSFCPGPFCAEILAGGSNALKNVITRNEVFGLHFVVKIPSASV